VLGGEGVQFRDFRQGTPSVGQLIELGVQRLQVDQAPLGGRVSVQWNCPPGVSRRAWSTDR
jgi:hypothetical protein